MKPYNYIKEYGVIRPDTAGVMADVTDEYKSILGIENTTNQSSFEGRLIDSEITARINTIEACCLIANQINPELANGVFLDAVCALTGAYRTKGTNSMVSCELTGIDGTVIPIGTLVTDGKNNWESIKEVTLTDSVVVTDFMCTKVGPITANSGTINKILSSVIGLETVNNPSNAVIGLSEQTDDELRNVRLMLLGINSNSNSNSIISSIYSVNGVQGVTYLENSENTEQTIKEIKLPPHSTYICVDGGSNEDIAEAYQVKKAGSTTFGKVTQAYVDPYSGQKIDIRFDRPTLKPIKIKIEIVKDSTTASYENIKDVVISYSLSLSNKNNGFLLGNSLSIFEITKAIENSITNIKIVKCELATASSKFSCDPIINKIFEKSTIDKNDIEINLI